MINNNICETCDKVAVCKIYDLLYKFSDEAKKPLGVNITIDRCLNYEYEDEGNEKV